MKFRRQKGGGGHLLAAVVSAASQMGVFPVAKLHVPVGSYHLCDVEVAAAAATVFSSLVSSQARVTLELVVQWWLLDLSAPSNNL